MNTAIRRASQKLISGSNIIFLIFCGIAFYFVVHNFTQLKTIQMLFNQIDGRWITAAILSQTLTYIAITIVYYVWANKLNNKTSVTFIDFLKLSVVTIFINQVVPSGGIGGNGFLLNELSNRGIDSKKSFFIIVMECLSLYVSLALLMIVLPLLYIGYHKTLPQVFLIVILFGFLLYGALSVLMTVLSNRNTLHHVIKNLSKIKFLKSHLQDITFSPQGTFTEYGVKRPWQIFLKYKQQSLIAIAAQWGLFFADTVTIFALLQGLHVHVAYIVIAFGLLLTYIVASLPISPGALLIYEGAMTFFYSTMGMPFATALIITLLYRVLSFWVPMVLGLALYKHVQTDTKN